MRQNPSFAELQSLLGTVALTKPRISESARAVLGATGDLISELGLPSSEADWFFAHDDIEVWPEADGARYQADGVLAEVANAVRIGRNEFGTFLINCSNGHVVYVEDAKQAQLINTSVERFLFFVGRIHRSEASGFADVAALIADCEAVDPEPLRNREGIWSVTLEEVEAGLY